MLITISGIDGSGKTTLCKTITEELISKGFQAKACMPDYICNNLMKEFAKNYYGDPYAYVPNFSEIYINGLFVDWLDTYDKILKKPTDEILIFDRYLFDFLAQAIHYQVKPISLLKMFTLFPYPDISFFISISPSLAFERLNIRSHPNMHHLESLENLEILNEAYNNVMEKVQWTPKVVSGLEDINLILDIIINKKDTVNDRRICIR